MPPVSVADTTAQECGFAHGHCLKNDGPGWKTASKPWTSSPYFVDAEEDFFAPDQREARLSGDLGEVIDGWKGVLTEMENLLEGR